LNQHIEILKSTYEEEQKDHANRWAAWDAIRKSILAGKKDGCLPETKESKLEKLRANGDEPVHPLIPMFITGEPTMEALVVNWKNYYPSLGLFSDEGSTFAGGYAMSKEKRGQTAGILCNAYGAKFERPPRANEEYISLDGRRLSMHLMFQPSTGLGLVSDKGLLGGGLLSRILFAYPDPTNERPWRDPVPDEERDIKKYENWLVDILSIPPRMKGGKLNVLDPIVLKLSSEALGVYKDFYTSVELQERKGGPLESIKDFTGKAGENALRIAAVLSIIDGKGFPLLGQISAYHMAQGVKIMNWYLWETLRVRAIANHTLGETQGSGKGKQDPNLIPNAEKLIKWLRERPENEIIYRDIMRKCNPPELRPKAILDEALAALVEYGHIVWMKGKGDKNIIRIIPENAPENEEPDSFKPWTPPEYRKPEAPNCHPSSETNLDDDLDEVDLNWKAPSPGAAFWEPPEGFSRGL
jgi:hypothetical protein